MIKKIIFLMMLGLISTPVHAAEEKTAIFAGGCFWSMEKAFEEKDGVSAAVSGFSGGQVENPSYRQVVGGGTGHLEAVKVTYDPLKVTYEDLVMHYWHSIDPTDTRGQFCDKGSTYLSAIFYNSDEEKEIAKKTKKAVAQQLGQSVATKILPAATFYPAEDYHQDYYKKNPLRYHRYRIGCLRDARKKEIWGEAR